MDEPSRGNRASFYVTRMQPATRGGFICVRVGTGPDNDGSLIEQVVDDPHRLGFS
jgi:hypothetical protein